jgi:hypothetical protein
VYAFCALVLAAAIVAGPTQMELTNYAINIVGLVFDPIDAVRVIWALFGE